MNIVKLCFVKDDYVINVKYFYIVSVLLIINLVLCSC